VYEPSVLAKLFEQHFAYQVIGLNNLRIRYTIENIRPLSARVHDSEPAKDGNVLGNGRLALPDAGGQVTDCSLAVA
jgi:hypothetical protein